MSNGDSLEFEQKWEAASPTSNRVLLTPACPHGMTTNSYVGMAIVHNVFFMVYNPFTYCAAGGEIEQGA